MVDKYEVNSNLKIQVHREIETVVVINPCDQIFQTPLICG